MDITAPHTPLPSRQNETAARTHTGFRNFFRKNVCSNDAGAIKKLKSGQQEWNLI